MRVGMVLNGIYNHMLHSLEAGSHGVYDRYRHQ